jgi:O-antigen ligase
MATFAALALPAVFAFETRRWRRWGSVVLIVALAAGSNSLTGLIGVILGLVLWGWLRILQRPPARDRAHIVMVTVAVVLMCVVAGWSSMALVAEFWGKDLTLTGRTLIWDAAIDVAQERPLTGYGPGGLYSWPWSEATRFILNRAGFWHNHVHNGLIEVQLSLGLVGLVLLFALLTTCLSDGVRLLRRHPAVGRWLITSVLLIVVMSMSERTFTGGGWPSMLALMRIVGLRVRQDRSVSSGPDVAVQT